MLELLLLIPFAAMSTAATSIAIQYRLAKKRGPEIPSMKPRPAVASLDPQRKLAIEIGKRELEAPATKAWDSEYHRALMDAGAPMIETGEVIYYNGRSRYPYYLEGCDCKRCVTTQRSVLDKRSLER